jgi:hypothetical protein
VSKANEKKNLPPPLLLYKYNALLSNMGFYLFLWVDLYIIINMNHLYEKGGNNA